MCKLDLPTDQTMREQLAHLLGVLLGRTLWRGRCDG